MSVALSILMQAEKPFDVFTLDKEAVVSEEGIRVLPDFSVDELVPGPMTRFF